MFTLAELESVMPLVRECVPPTPQYAWPLLQARTGVEVVVKHENHTPIGAFKVRGGLVYLEPAEARTAAAERGHHGNARQSRPVACLRRPPRWTVREHRRAARQLDREERSDARFGAELIEHGHDFDDAREACDGIAAERGLEFAPSFHRDFVVGVATYAYELFGAVEGLDTVYAPIGLGSGLCGLIGMRDLLRLSTRIVGVVADGANAYRRSVDRRPRQSIPTPRSPLPTAWRCACRTPPHWRS